MTICFVFLNTFPNIYLIMLFVNNRSEQAEKSSANVHLFVLIFNQLQSHYNWLFCLQMKKNVKMIIIFSILE